MGITTNYSFEYPTVGGSENVWGTTLNNTVIAIDTQIKTVSDSIPTSIVASSITDTPNNFTSSGSKFVKVNSGATAIEFTTASVNDLSDVTISNVQSGQVLKWDGSAFTNQTEPPPPSSGIALTDLSVTTGSASQGGSLSYNSSTGQFTFVPTDYNTLLTVIADSRRGATSTDFTVTAGGTFTFAHQLNASPFMIQWAIVCTQADHGYSVGDTIFGTDTVANASHSPSVYVESGDTTNVKGVFPSLGTFQIASKASGVVGNTVTTTAGRWKMRLKVMK
mgnify:CR=1 FL=1